MSAAGTTSRKAKTTTPADEPMAPALPWWHAPTVAARDAVSLLLNAACDLDIFDEDSDSNYALRLLGMATVVVDDDMLPAEVLNAEDPQNAVADACFNCIALLRATLVHPDGSFDIRRRTWVLHALSILDVLTDLHMAGPNDGPGYVGSLKDVINRPEALHPTPAEPSASRPRPPSVSASDASDDDEHRRRFALACVTQIGELADGMKVFEEAESDDRSPFIYGVCSRIALLATLIFQAQRLHGDPDDQWGDRTVRDLQAAFDGRMV